VIKSSTKGYAGHVTCTGKRGGTYRVLLGKPETDHLEDLSIDGRMILI